MDCFDRWLGIQRDTPERIGLPSVPIDGCDRHRAEGLTPLAVDLAIVALQLVASNLDTRTMSRLDTPRRSGTEANPLAVNGYYAFGSSKMMPGLCIGPGTLADLLHTTKSPITAVGRRLSSLVTGHLCLPNLEMAWRDARLLTSRSIGRAH